MAQELIYTSAPRGLKPGSRGFCTVGTTRGMASNLAEKLESLSGYRHVYLPQDPNAHLNPVVFSHLRITVGGRQYHVLSRICAAGVDYTQRSNKLAHHVVLDVGELPAAGPAWLLAPERELMRLTWDGEPRVLTAPRRVPNGDVSADICRAWGGVTGDAGWGGWLAETAASGRGKQVYLIFRPGMDLLALVAESLALLPLEIRWDVTFSTYHTMLPAGVDCQWRCVVEGSPEAVAARRIPHNAVLDLCGPLGRAPASPYVEMGRTGIWPVSAAQATPAVEQLPGREPELLPDSLATSGAIPCTGLAPGEYAVMPPVPPPRPPARYRPVRRKFKRKRALGLRLAIAGAVVLMLGAFVAGIIMWASGYLEPPQVARDESRANAAGESRPEGKPEQARDSKATRKMPAPKRGTTPKTDAQENAATGKAQNARQKGDAKAAPENTGIEGKTRNDEAKPEEKEPAEVTQADAKKATIERTRKALESLHSEIDLPRLDDHPPQPDSELASGSSQPAKPLPQPAFIGTADYTQVAGLQLTLFVGAPKFGGDSTFTLKPSTDVSQNQGRWGRLGGSAGEAAAGTAVMLASGAVAALAGPVGADVLPVRHDKTQIWSCCFVRNPGTASATAIEVGQFVMGKDGFLFRWSEQALRGSGKVKEANQLRNCILSVSAAGIEEPGRIRLRKPIDTDPKKLDLSKRTQFFEVGVDDPEHFPADESIRVSWHLTNLPNGTRVVPEWKKDRAASLLVNEALRVRLSWVSGGAGRKKPGFDAEYTDHQLGKPFSDSIRRLETRISKLWEQSNRLKEELQTLSPLVPAGLRHQKEEHLKKCDAEYERCNKERDEYEGLQNSARLNVRVAAVVKDPKGSEYEVVIVKTAEEGRESADGSPPQGARPGAKGTQARSRKAEGPLNTDSITKPKPKTRCRYEGPCPGA